MQLMLMFTFLSEVKTEISDRINAEHVIFGLSHLFTQTRMKIGILNRTYRVPIWQDHV